MFLQAINELKISLTLKATSPLLIREGRYNKDVRESWARTHDDPKVMPNAIPVSRSTEAQIREAVTKRTTEDIRRSVEQLQFYVPGSSMRGAWRSHLERTLRDVPEKTRICDPFDEKAGASEGCGSYSNRYRDHQEKQKKPKEIIPYALACPICKLFGATSQRGRFTISDGELKTRGSIVEREHVRVDRKSGQVARGALFRFLGLKDATFQVEIGLRNFELWQVLLIGSLLTELRRGLIPLGSGKSKGYGQVQAELGKIVLTSFGMVEPDGVLRGAGEQTDPVRAVAIRKRYGITTVEHPPTLRAGKWDRVTPWRFERELAVDEFDEAWKQIKFPWDAFRVLAQREPVGQVP